MTTEKTPKTPCDYVCESCDFHSSNKKDFSRHLQSIKHKNNASTTPGNAENPTYVCPNCNKSHKDRAGLWRHKKKCNPAPEPPTPTPAPAPEPALAEDLAPDQDTSSNQPITTAMMMEVMKQSKEIQTFLMEQNAKLTEDCKMFMELYHKERANTITCANSNSNNNNNNNNTNSNNNTFNLNFFLNEKCKNAITLDEFVTNLPVTVEDLVHTSQVGYVNGITDIFMKGLKDMDVYTRPIHCTDIKRETVYVKEPDGWKKDVPEENTQEKPKLRLAVKRLARKNSLQLNTWMEQNPECEDTNSQASEEFIKISDSLLGGVYDGEEVKFQNTIMRNVLKKVTIEETKVTAQR
jgi:hypothetical protein